MHDHSHDTMAATALAAPEAREIAPYTGEAAIAMPYLLRIADSALILSHRLSEWAGHGPVLEEDIALANIALDLLGQARLLYPVVSAIEGRGRSEDDLAFWRTEDAFFNFTVCELPNSGVASAGAATPDYAFTIVRNALFSQFALLRWEALTQSSYGELAAIAAKAVKETRYHLRHAQDWLVRFGDGTEQSHAFAQAALDSVVPYCNEFFHTDAIDLAAAQSGLGVQAGSLHAPWLEHMQAMVTQATLQWPAASKLRTTGTLGAHSEHMGFLLAEMQSLARQHPGATW
jgi:ring-1,2-phenylacetyl-CoA epoxidase subunit PaaC